METAFAARADVLGVLSCWTAFLARVASWDTFFASFLGPFATRVFFAVAAAFVLLIVRPVRRPLTLLPELDALFEAFPLLALDVAFAVLFGAFLLPPLDAAGAVAFEAFRLPRLDPAVAFEAFPLLALDVAFAVLFKGFCLPPLDVAFAVLFKGFCLPPLDVLFGAFLLPPLDVALAVFLAGPSELRDAVVFLGVLLERFRPVWAEPLVRTVA